MPLSPFIRRSPIKPTVSRGPTPLAKVKAHYSAAQQQNAVQHNSRIQQLSRDQARIARAIPSSADPIKTNLQRRSNLVNNQIGWLQGSPTKK